MIRTFSGRGFGSHFGNHLRAFFELYEYHHHRNVIVIKINKAREYHNLSLYYRRRGKPYLIKYSDNIIFYHYITRRRRHSYLLTYSDNIMIYHYITGGRRNSN